MCVHGSIKRIGTLARCSAPQKLPSSQRHRDATFGPIRSGEARTAATVAAAPARARRRQGRVAHAGSPQSGRAARRSGTTRVGGSPPAARVGPRRQLGPQARRRRPLLGGASDGATARATRPRAGARGGERGGGGRVVRRGARRHGVASANVGDERDGAGARRWWVSRAGVAAAGGAGGGTHGGGVGAGDAAGRHGFHGGDAPRSVTGARIVHGVTQSRRGGTSQRPRPRRRATRPASPSVAPLHAAALRRLGDGCANRTCGRRQARASPSIPPSAAGAPDSSGVQSSPVTRMSQRVPVATTSAMMLALAQRRPGSRLQLASGIREWRALLPLGRAASSSHLPHDSAARDREGVQHRLRPSSLAVRQRPRGRRLLLRRPFWSECRRRAMRRRRFMTDGGRRRRSSTSCVNGDGWHRRPAGGRLKAAASRGASCEGEAEGGAVADDSAATRGGRRAGHRSGGRGRTAPESSSMRWSAPWDPFSIRAMAARRMPRGGAGEHLLRRRTPALIATSRMLRRWRRGAAGGGTMAAADYGEEVVQRATHMSSRRRLADV